MNDPNPALGPYTLIRTLGEGTTGKVKLAMHQITHQCFAVKIIKKSNFDTKANLKTKIQREIALMRLVDHPHILKLHDILESPRHLYIVLEYASQGELFDYLVKRKFLPEEDAMVFFRQLIYGLEYLHSLGICHRDLKPENILLDNNNCIKIADFGFARFVQASIADTSCGSPHYAAPEVIRGVPYNGRAADVWSCGVILYALLAGYLPFDDQNIRTLLSKVKRGLYTMPNTFSERAKSLIQGMLTIDPTKRLTIAQIKCHECFIGNIDHRYIFPSPLPHNSITEPIDPSNITEDIVDTLLKIGYPDPDTLLAELHSDSPTIGKVFFHMMTSKVLIEQLNWSSSVGSLASDNQETDAFILSPLQKSFALTGSDPFHRHHYKMGTPKDEPVSFANRADWVIPAQDPIEYTMSHQIVCQNFTLEQAMLGVQITVNRFSMQWFHPDDYSILCRSLDLDLYSSIIADITQEGIVLEFQYISGSNETFSMLCQIGQSIISELYQPTD